MTTYTLKNIIKYTKVTILLTCTLFIFLYSIINKEITTNFIILGAFINTLIIFSFFKKVKKVKDLKNKHLAAMLLLIFVGIITIYSKYIFSYYQVSSRYTEMTNYSDYDKYYKVILKNCPSIKCDENIQRYYWIAKSYLSEKKDCLYSKKPRCNNKDISLEASIFHLFEYEDKGKLFDINDRLSILELLTRDVYMLLKDDVKIPYFNEYLEVITSLYILYLRDYDIEKDGTNLKVDSLINIKILQKRMKYFRSMSKKKD
jgi:hypothetical protein